MFSLSLSSTTHNLAKCNCGWNKQVLSILWLFVTCIIGVSLSKPTLVSHPRKFLIINYAQKTTEEFRTYCKYKNNDWYDLLTLQMRRVQLTVTQIIISMIYWLGAHNEVCTWHSIQLPAELLNFVILTTLCTKSLGNQSAAKMERIKRLSQRERATEVSVGRRQPGDVI